MYTTVVLPYYSAQYMLMHSYPHILVWTSVVCMYVCMIERERERECVCVCVCVCIDPEAMQCNTLSLLYGVPILALHVPLPLFH